MTEHYSKGDSYMQVLTDEHGSILAAVRRVAAETSGEDVAPELFLGSSEGQVLHELALPSGVAGDELFGKLDQFVVEVAAGTPTLVPRS
jgi:hypothetical protein